MKRGFTVIELLVVMGIIALLIGLMIPTLSHAKERARQTCCSNNLRNLGLAVAMYVDDNDGWLLSAEPMSRESVSPLHWFMNEKYLKYIDVELAYDENDELIGPKGEKTVLVCPSDRNPRLTRPRDGEPSVVREYGLSYGMNGTFGLGGRPDHVAHCRLTQYKNPCQTCALADCWGTSLGPGVVHYQSCVQENMTGRHMGHANIVYLDCHVDALPPEEVPLGFANRYDPFWGVQMP